MMDGNDLRGLCFFGQCVIHLIDEGKHESQGTILEEMQHSNLVSYIIHKYNTRFPDTAYDLDSLRGCCKTKVEQQPLFLLKSIRGGVFWGKDVEKLPVF